jgi:hypothetical protein
LNRAKAEKWTGSNLTKPSLLVFPKKNAKTSANTRRFDAEELRKSKKKMSYARNRSRNPDGVPFGGGAMYYMTSNSLHDAHTNLAFLDHHAPLLVIPVNPDTGTIDIASHSGHLLQMVVISGNQSVFYQQLTHETTLKLNDLRQSANSNKTLIRSKAVSKVSSSIVLQTHEYETIDSFEKLFDTVIKISNCGSELENTFAFLRNWPSLSVQKKLETHQEHVSHEINLWLKKKDPQFFDEYIKPVIKVITLVISINLVLTFFVYV